MIIGKIFKTTEKEKFNYVSDKNDIVSRKTFGRNCVT